MLGIRIVVHYYPLYEARRFSRELSASAPAGIMAVGLVEDGLFEEKIQLSVSLLAERLWNPFRSEDELLQQALMRTIPCRNCRGQFQLAQTEI